MTVQNLFRSDAATRHEILQKVKMRGTLRIEVRSETVVSSLHPDVIYLIYNLSLKIVTCDFKRRVSGLQHAQAPQTSISLSAPRHCWLWPICPHCGRTWPDRGLHQQLAPRPTPRVPVGTIHALNIAQQNCFGTCIGRIDSKIHDSTRPSTDSKSSLKVKDSMKTLGLQTCHTMSHCLHRSTKEVFSL